MRGLLPLALVLLRALQCTSQPPTLSDVVPVELSVTPVAFPLCTRHPNVTKLDGYVVATKQPFLDVGFCSGICVQTPFIARHYCKATATHQEWVVIKDKRQQMKVIDACECTCKEIKKCQSGFYWDRWLCECRRIFTFPPCQRAPLYSPVLATLANLWMDVGRCRGYCRTPVDTCQPLVFGIDTVDADGQDASRAQVLRCGCSDCRVQAQFISYIDDSGAIVSQDVGQCGGSCANADVPAGVATVSFLPTTCLATKTETAVLNATLNATRVLRCDCRPKCQRVSLYTILRDPVTDQLMDVGVCVGQCEAGSGRCGVVGRQPADCNGTACSGVPVVTQCGCLLP